MILLFLIIFGVMFGPPIVLASLGISARKKNPDASKRYFILAVVYLIIAGGVCYSMINQGFN